MSELSTILVGALVTMATYFITKLADGILNDALRTATKALMALGVAFVLACLQLLIAGGFTWPGLWDNLPVVVASAMTLYGLILKPVTKL